MCGDVSLVDNAISPSADDVRDARPSRSVWMKLFGDGQRAPEREPSA